MLKVNSGISYFLSPSTSLLDFTWDSKNIQARIFRFCSKENPCLLLFLFFMTNLLGIFRLLNPLVFYSPSASFFDDFLGISKTLASMVVLVFNPFIS